jgi:hypothetical protein
VGVGVGEVDGDGVGEADADAEAGDVVDLFGDGCGVWFGVGELLVLACGLGLALPVAIGEPGMMDGWGDADGL